MTAACRNTGWCRSEVTIKSCSGGMYRIKFEDGGGIKVKEHRLFATKEDAESSISKQPVKKKTP